MEELGRNDRWGIISSGMEAMGSGGKVSLGLAGGREGGRGGGRGGARAGGKERREGKLTKKLPGLGCSSRDDASRIIALLFSE